MFTTRIAPSPTGDMHLGTARTAYFNYLAARASGGKFLLRIDDTDQTRSKPEYTQIIIDTMAWLGLNYDEIIHQSRRFDFYKSAASSLMDGGWAIEKDGAIVVSFEARRKDGYIFPKAWHDDIAGDIAITPTDIEHMDGMVLIKSDGSPSYNFCSVVDDYAFEVNLIIRGVDHITNTSRQAILWEILNPGVPLPRFAHVGLILKDKKKLSKRDGAASMLYYRDKGYHPEAVLNFMARLGWSPKKDDETTKTLPQDRMLAMFLTEGSLKSNDANMNLNSLESYDRKYKARDGVWRTKAKLIQE